MAKQIITPATQTQTQTATQPTAAQAYAQAYALALTAVRARKAAENAAKAAQEAREEEREAKQIVKGMTNPAPTHTPIMLEDVEDTPTTTNNDAAKWVIAASLSLLSILFLIYIITISIH